MMSQEVADALGLMGREIVHNEVDLAATRLAGHNLAEEGDELFGRVPRRGLPEHFATLGIQGSVERESAMAVVFEAMGLSPPRRERKYGIQAVERLNGSLLVNAEDRGVLGRIDV